MLEETKRNKLKLKTGNRVIKYGEKIELIDNKLLENFGKKYRDPERKMQRYFERNGYSRQEIQNRRERGENIIQVFIHGDMDNQKQYQWKKITESRYHANYQKCVH